MTDQIFDIIQIVTAILLILVILTQNIGSGMGAAFGGEGNAYRTKRGLEKKLHYATIILSVTFFSVSLLNVLI